MISLPQLRRFLHKTPQQRAETARFFARRALSKLPYLPIYVRLFLSSQETTTFWWSYLPVADHPGRSLHDYWGDDVEELRFLWRALKPDSSFMDIGAYHGIYSLIASRRIQKPGHIVAFEPSPRERQRLHLHFRMNHVSSVVLEPYAVGAQCGEAPLFMVVSGFTSMNSLRRPASRDAVQPVAVKTITLDGYLEANRVKRLDIIKLDAEGGELEILRGARGMLEDLRPIILCEVLDWVTGPWGYAARDIVSHLRDRGYAWFDFRSDGMLSLHAPQDVYPEIRNYLAVPLEKIDTVQEWIQ